MPLFFILLILPFCELALLIKAGTLIGFWNTIGICLLTALLGAILVRYQGLKTMLAARSQLAGGRLPLDQLFDGICIACAGALLMTPGFITDTMGFLLLIPAVRNLLRALIRQHTDWAAGWSVQGEYSASRRPSDPNIIEGEFEEIQPDSPALPRRPAQEPGPSRGP
jgi:UPF0716 protein FxsA